MRLFRLLYWKVFALAQRWVEKEDKEYRAMREFLREQFSSLSRIITLTAQGWHIEFKIVLDGSNAKKIRDAVNDSNPLLDAMRHHGAIKNIDDGGYTISEEPD